MAYAIIRTGGKQYRVAPGEVVDIERIEVGPGEKTTFNEVLLHADGAAVSFGAPLVAGASVTGKVMEHRRAGKVIAYKFTRRTGYARTKGHKQHLTRVKIESINA